jgi:hypothetical protein
MSNPFQRVDAAKLWLLSANGHEIKKGKKGGFYFFLVFGFAFALAFDFVFAFALAGFIGASQQINSTSSHPQGSSITTTSPHSSHSNFSPFFAKSLHLPQNANLYALVVQI